MATPFDFANIGSMFGGGMGGTPSGLDALLTEDQRKLMNRNAALSAAAALLQASGRSATPIGLGQALGSALQAGQQGYQQARAGSLQDLMVGEKLKEAQDERQRNVDYFKLLEQANLSQQQLALMRGLPREKGLQFALDALKPEASPDAIKTLRALGLPTTLENLRLLDKPEASPAEVRILQATGTPITLANIIELRKSGASNVNVKVPVDMTGGQKGFENEMKLSGAFKQEPIYKDFNDMKSAYGQVVSSLAQGTPIGDVAGATKVMKLLDPGSVVRESELGIAMAAAGRMDLLQNYFNNLMTGQKLTPTQREDFKRLSNELYAAAGQAYNNKRGEYEQFGKTYGFKNLDTALGAPATVPSIVKSQPASATKTMQWDGTKFVFK